MTSPLTTAQQVRLAINDRLRYQEEVRAGDGQSISFKLAQGAPFASLTGASAYVPTGAGGWSATGATFDLDLGTVAFAGIISAQSAWRATYQWAVFSENEIGHFTAAGGDINGACIEAVRTLMFDGLRRAKWAAPDGSQHDDTKAQDTLLKMWSAFKAEQYDGAEGGVESWSEQQAYWAGEYNG